MADVWDGCAYELAVGTCEAACVGSEMFVVNGGGVSAGEAVGKLGFDAGQASWLTRHAGIVVNFFVGSWGAIFNADGIL